MKRSTGPCSASVVAVASLGVLLSSPSHAYLDPGTGSIILQGLLASLAVGIGVLRRYWQEFTSFLAKFKIGSRAVDDQGRDDIEQKSEIRTKP